MVPDLAKGKELEAGDDDAMLGESWGSMANEAITVAAAPGSGDGDTFHSEPVPLGAWGHTNDWGDVPVIIVHELKADKTIDRHSRDEWCGVCVRVRERASACVRQTLMRRIQNTSYLMPGEDASEARSRARGSGAAAEAGKQAAARDRVSLDARRGILASGAGFIVSK